MKHVVQMIPGLDRIGGAERQVMLLAKGLKRRGWRVSVVALSGSGGTAAAELRDAGVEFLSLRMRKGLADPRGWVQMHRWLRRERPSVVHAHLRHAAWLGRWTIVGLRAGRGASSVPVFVDTVHSPSTGTMGRRLGYRWSKGIPDCVTAVSEAAAAAYRAAHIVDPRKLRVLPNGVDLDMWRADAEARVAVRGELQLKDEFLWLAVGRLERVKDYPTLLAALARLPSAARLLIAGSGPLDGELKALSTWLGLGGRVRFLGFEPDVGRWMKAADGFVLSSRWEGLPMAVLEAGACGVPVVATNVAGTREIVEDGVTGRLTPAGDSAALANAMEAVMRAPAEERRAMGERERCRVVERCGLENVLDRWEELYRDLLAV